MKVDLENHLQISNLTQTSRGENIKCEEDVWALGLILIRLLTSRRQLVYLKPGRVYQCIQKNYHLLEFNLLERHMSEKALSFLRHIFVLHSSHKPDIKQLAKHPFITKCRGMEFDLNSWAIH